MYKKWCNFIENHLSKVMKKDRIARFFLVVCFLNINIDMQLQAQYRIRILHSMNENIAENIYSWKKYYHGNFESNEVQN